MSLVALLAKLFGHTGNERSGRSDSRAPAAADADTWLRDLANPGRQKNGFAWPSSPPPQTSVGNDNTHCPSSLAAPASVLPCWHDPPATASVDNPPNEAKPIDYLRLRPIPERPARRLLAHCTDEVALPPVHLLVASRTSGVRSIPSSRCTVGRPGKENLFHTAA